MDSMKLNSEVAYKGRIGRLRELYCKEQLRYMGACYKKISEDQSEYALLKGKTIYCGKNCDGCCSYTFIGATLQECEAIAYYLQSNHEIRDWFVARFPEWRESVREKGDHFLACQKAHADLVAHGSNERDDAAFDAAIENHNRQHIGCPFLDQGLCAIYEARPTNCAGFFATSPPERCQPGKDTEESLKPEFALTRIDDVVNDTSFYYKELRSPVTLYMPVAVYQILDDGYRFLQQFAGIEGIKQEALGDPEVRSIIRSL